MKGLFVLDENAFELIYPQAVRKPIESAVVIEHPRQTAESVVKNPGILREVDVIFSGWGAPLMDEAFLSAAPRLKAVFYGAGSVRRFVTDAFWERGLVLSSAVRANAVPVAEYTLSQILFGLKGGWQHNRLSKDPGVPRLSGLEAFDRVRAPGAYGSTVGLVSLGTIARLVIGLLRSFDIRTIAYDPFASPETAAQLGIELCSLDDVFRRAHVVSVHTPALPETEGLINGRLLELLGPDATFINTSRSSVVDTGDLIDVLERRPDLWAVLDVTEKATDEQFRRLQELPNTTLTPHIAGSTGPECGRMGQTMLDELTRFLEGSPLKHRITRNDAVIMA